MAIQNNAVEYPREFSDELVNLLIGMLDKEASQRFSIEQVLSHPWLVNN